MSQTKDSLETVKYLAPVLTQLMTNHSVSSNWHCLINYLYTKYALCFPSDIMKCVIISAFMKFTESTLNYNNDRLLCYCVPFYWLRLSLLPKHFFLFFSLNLFIYSICVQINFCETYETYSLSAPYYWCNQVSSELDGKIIPDHCGALCC